MTYFNVFFFCNHSLIRRNSHGSCIFCTTLFGTLCWCVFFWNFRIPFCGGEVCTHLEASPQYDFAHLAAQHGNFSSPSNFPDQPTR